MTAVAGLALLAVAWTSEEAPMPGSSTELAAAAIPPIDTKVPQVIQTATFALG
jgi:hypothetical protein